MLPVCSAKNVVTPFRGKLYTLLAAMCGSECYYNQAKYN